MESVMITISEVATQLSHDIFLSSHGIETNKQKIVQSITGWWESALLRDLEK